VNVRLLVTRPLPDAERTAAALRTNGHAVTITPLLHVETLADAELGAGPWAAILVTSANAARAIAGHKRIAELRALPVLAVGERSAAAMRSAGFTHLSSAEGAASDLTRSVAERLKHGEPLLYLAGADRSADIAADLAAQNFLVRTVVVYRAIQADVLPEAAAEALKGGIGGVVHFSRRSAEAYVNVTRSAGLSEPAVKKPAHFCLSAKVAEPLVKAGAGDIRIAQEPTEPALLALIPAISGD
jgi:uroporphyrinogen-III synthase